MNEYFWALFKTNEKVKTSFVGINHLTAEIKVRLFCVYKTMKCEIKLSVNCKQALVSGR